MVLIGIVWLWGSCWDLGVAGEWQDWVMGYRDEGLASSEIGG